jgi:hypothetical protein
MRNEIVNVPFRHGGIVTGNAGGCQQDFFPAAERGRVLSQTMLPKFYQLTLIRQARITWPVK